MTVRSVKFNPSCNPNHGLERVYREAGTDIGTIPPFLPHAVRARSLCLCHSRVNALTGSQGLEMVVLRETSTVEK